MEEIPRITVDTVRPLIESFFQRLSAGQRTVLRTGSPDDATKVLLVDLLLDIITSVSNTMLTAFSCSNEDVSEERVLSSLGDTLPQTFAEVLDVQEEVECISSQRLSDLVAKEVAASLNSALSASMHSADEPASCTHITTPNRVNTMLIHACKILKELMAKMNNLCPVKPRKCRQSEELAKEELCDVEMTAVSEGCQSSVRTGSGRSKEASSQRSSAKGTAEAVSKKSLESAAIDDGCQSSDKTVETTAKLIQEIIMKEVKEVMEPLLDELSDAEYELLQSKSAQEIEVVASDIAQIIKKVSCQSSKSNGKKKLPMKTMLDKIRTFFTKHFATAYIHKIGAQLKRKFHKDSKVESRESMKSLMADVDSLLETEEGEQAQDVCQKFESSCTDDDKFLEELRYVLFLHVTDGMRPKNTQESPNMKSRSKAPVSLSHAEMCADIGNKVRSFLGLMRWWLKTQVTHCSRRITRALTGTEGQAPTEVPEVALEERSEPLVTAPISPATSARDKTPRSQDITPV
ncbi:hypothetical protein L3Q82_000028 [Scortum barcoo]|uniref:Uncharacterized protein n=1 Tax=Scortum barcoo TaxID=214431 RepID=A0ACB8XB82_9TELE|nr:hypothetical protein L3Q82_000028 [Scortum barcoo]